MLINIFYLKLSHQDKSCYVMSPIGFLSKGMSILHFSRCGYREILKIYLIPASTILYITFRFIYLVKLIMFGGRFRRSPSPRWQWLPASSMSRVHNGLPKSPQSWRRESSVPHLRYVLNYINHQYFLIGKVM